MHTRNDSGQDLALSHDSGASPTVILESSVIAQGLPWPENLETALEVEDVIRRTKATAATIAILDGKVRIGLTGPEIERLARFRQAPASGDSSEAAQSPANRIIKANRRDLAVVLSQEGNAATTVSATVWLARHFGPGPAVMATGGLGGVHRGAGESFDVSTDLDELARADGFVVVCSGFKSILDLPATLEALETRGVLVVGYQTHELPAFTTRESGLNLEHRVDSPFDAATLIRCHRRLKIPGAIVVANPVPAEDAISRSLAKTALSQALREAEHGKITGKNLTPFLLESIRHATAGASLRANRALLISNARLAAEIAVALDGLADSTSGGE